MPPPIPQQGSRAGLITSVIVFVILWLVSMVLFFQEQGKRKLAESEREQIEKKYTDKWLPAELNAGPVKQARDLVAGESGGGAEGAAPAGPVSGPPIYDKNLADTLAPDEKDAFSWVNKERDELIKMIWAQAATGKDAKAYIIDMHRKAEEAIKGVTVRPDGINFSMDPAAIAVKLAEAYKKLDQAKIDALAAVDAEKKRYADLEAANKTLAASHQAALAAVQKQITDKDTALKDLEARYAVAIQQTTQANAAGLDALNQQIAALTPQIPPLQAEIEKLKKDKVYLQGILRRYRMDPSDNIVRRPDGAITRVADDGRTCYINLGQGDNISTGMTFEVYSKETGVPSLKADIAGMDDESVKRIQAARDKLKVVGNQAVGGAIATAGGEKYDTQLPQGGKGSIEVIRIDPVGRSAECRVIKAEPGQRILQGDLIANLVYDANVKFRFGVYGNFDLDYNGIPSLSDTNVIKRLIEQWGGRVNVVNTIDDVTPELDFLVVGIRPQVPPLPENPTAVDIDFQTKKKQEQAVFDDVQNRAREWSIPVLNQTRFLYYTGYFDQRLR